MSRKPIYVSVDIEADGPIPGIYSMLSLGAAAFELGNRTPLDTFEINLSPLPGASQDTSTMVWWSKQPEAWNYITQNQQDPQTAMATFRTWLKNLPGNPTFVGYPVTFDFMFTHWYLVRFTGFPTPFGISGCDLKTKASTLLKTPFRELSKKTMPKGWFEGYPPHTHKALDDAIGQGIMFINMMMSEDPYENSSW